MGQDSTEEYIKKHITRVRNHLITFINLLRVRANSHDRSKLEEPELSWWKEMDKEPRYPYGSAEYTDKMKRWKKVFDHHYKHNSHHPEHFEEGINGMTLIDIIEMLCDWVGYKSVMSITEAINTVDQQMDRYGFSQDLRDIIKNTLLEYFAVLGGFVEGESIIYNTPVGIVKELGTGKSEKFNAKDKTLGNYVDIAV